MYLYDYIDMYIHSYILSCIYMNICLYDYIYKKILIYGNT